MIWYNLPADQLANIAKSISLDQNENRAYAQITSVL